MWLMTRHGFYSIVRKGPGQFHVRGRERCDLENLVARVPLQGVEIHRSKAADYAVRIIVDAENVSAILRFLGESIDYDNFKGRIARTPDQARKPYHEVWQVLADALGSYGKPGRRSGDASPG